VPPDELLQEFEFDPNPIWPAEDDRLEPIFLAGLLAAELEEFAQLDPERNTPEPEDWLPKPRQRAAALSLCGSFGLHLLPLLVLIHWSSAPAEIADAMPVQLVFEEPPSGSSQEEGKPPPSPPLSETQLIAEKSSGSGATYVPASPPVTPPRQSLAAITPPPPAPAPPPEPPPRKPAAVTLAAAPPTPAASNSAATANLREAQIPGTDPVQTDYFSRLAALTRDHLDLLPLSFLGGRRGRTILSIHVQGDGTIGQIAVKRSSGYPDIDTRIEEIVIAVGRFPPVPERFQKPDLDLDFNLVFPDALQ
jgi:outer membrane biosynthesis protein TonB